MMDFCRAVRTGSTPLSSSEIGLEVVRMIEAVDSSLAANGARVATATGPEAELPLLEEAATVTGYPNQIGMPEPSRRAVDGRIPS